MQTRHTAPTEAYSPDANRVGPDVPALLAERLVYLLARIILFLLQRRPCRSRGPAAWFHQRPDLPPGSAQAEAASIRGTFGRAIEWMCRGHGIGPRHPDRPELARAIVAFGGSVHGFVAACSRASWPWWENPEIVPYFIRVPRRLRPPRCNGNLSFAEE